MENPYVTVVILTIGRATKVLECLEKQTFRNFEVLLASEPGIVNAMNIALAKAKGKILVRIDDDVFLPSTWLQELVKPFGNSYIGGATGPTFVPKERRKNRDSIRWAEKPNWFLRWMFDGKPQACAKIYNCGSVSYGSNFKENFENWMLSPAHPGHYEADHLEGTNWAMRTDLIRQVGGFDSAFNGVAEWFDTDVEQKVKKLGYKLRYMPSAWMNHLLEKGSSFPQRFEMFGRIDNWLKFHRRHSKFHYKKVIWLLMMLGYALWPKSR